MPSPIGGHGPTGWTRWPSILRRTAPKTAAFALLWFAIVAQAIWIGVRHLGHNEDLRQFWNATSYIFYFAVPYILLALTGGRVRWIASLLRLPIALAFLQAVADRFGLLGIAKQHISAARIVGLVLLVAGVALVVRK